MDPNIFFTHTQHNAGIPYPFKEVPPPDEPLTDLRLMDILGPLLAQVAGLTQVLAVTKLDEVPHNRLRAVHGLLAQHTAAAQTLLRRWWDDRQED